MNKDEFKAAKLKNARLLITVCPRAAFTTEERGVLMGYVREGGYLFVLAGEGGDRLSQSNLNALLESTGIGVQSTAVVRTAYYKYYHPKEVFVSNGVLQPEMLGLFGAGESKPTDNFYSEDTRDDSDGEETGATGLKLVYPFGTTLSVRTPAVPLLSSGTVSYPVNEAVMAYAPLGSGAVFVLGAWRALSDDYYDKEENASLMAFVLNFIAKRGAAPPRADERLADRFFHRRMCPDIESLSENLKCAIQDVDDASGNFLGLFERSHFRTHFDLLPESLALYKQLGVKQEPIKLINPLFETPLLGLRPAVFPPILVEPEEPALELFDLDDEFANPEAKLAQLTNNAEEADLDIYITESANVLGLKDKVNCNDAKEVLVYVLSTLIKCKISN